MNEKDKRFLSYWEEKRRSGRIKFALLHGFLFGALVFIFVTLVSYFTHDGIISTRAELLLNLIFLIIGGIFYEGGFTWWVNSRRYKKLTSNSNP